MLHPDYANAQYFRYYYFSIGGYQLYYLFIILNYISFLFESNFLQILSIRISRWIARCPLLFAEKA
tara:strand:- start:1804 stop:2001 length:198 start_codon:yes stop_codon:yes gene_type:complete